jgi:hypothetical protein
VKWPRVSWKGAAIQRGLQPGGRGIAVVKSRYQETSSNRLRTLMYVCVCVTVICKVCRSAMAL